MRPPTSLRAPQFFLLLLALACTGEIGQSTEVDDPFNIDPDSLEPRVDFACQPGEQLDPPLRRLSRAQYATTVRDLVYRIMGPFAEDVVLEIEEPLGELPRDTQQAFGTSGQRLFGRADQSLSTDGVRESLAVGEALGRAMTASSERITQWAGACATDADVSNDGPCLDALVENLGLLTHRRPLSADEFAFYRNEAYVDGNEIVPLGLAELVNVLLAQPAFGFHLEGTGQLDAYEIANRLSYHFWNTMPDEELFAAAESGALMTDAGWSREVDRIVRDPRAHASMREFLRQWLRMDTPVPLSAGSGRPYETLRGELTLNGAFDRDAEAEIFDLFVYVTEMGGTFEDFFTSTLTLTQSPELAALYGMEPSDGMPVEVPTERHGILTRANLLMARSDITPPGPGARSHPILRGVFISRQILCQTLRDPPPEVELEVDYDPMASTREAVETLTSPTFCASCHGTLNAPGFALEEFDSIGRYRNEELLFDTEGAVVGSVPINSTVSGGRLPQIDGGADLSRKLYDTEQPSACFARHYVRFTLGRAEDPDGADGCILQTLDEAIDAGRPLSEVMALVVLDPAFQVRMLGGE